MRHSKLLALVTTSLLVSLPALTWSASGNDKPQSVQENKNRGAEMRSRAEQTVDDMSAAQEEAREQARDRRDADRRVPDAEEIDEEIDLESPPDEHQDIGDAAGAEMGSRQKRNAENAQGKGSAKAQEMRARRDERKAIQEQYRSVDRATEMEMSSAPIDPDVDPDEADEAPEAKKDQAKKPWWKFWED